MHAILTSFGTDGDVVPFIGLGAVLRERGHRVTLVTGENYRSPASEAGLEFVELFSDLETRQVLANPDFWHPVKGPIAAARWGAAFLDREYQILSKLADEGDAVIVASLAILPARVLQDRTGVPVATVVLQPWMIASSIAPPTMPAGLSLPRWAPGPIAAIYWRLIDALGDLLVGRHVNELRESVGLQPLKRVFQWWNSPELVIGMFPDWYGPPQPDWPGQMRLSGFPMFDGRAGQALPDDVAAFCRAGKPPVAFTFGTGMMHAGDLFHASVEACRMLNLRGIFLTRYQEHLPQPLPPTIHHCGFAPFQELFPRCAAVVHHGGVGTVAKALAAGRPQLILPLAYDQLDNACRVKRLGTGTFIRAKRASGRRIAAALQELLTGPTSATCQQIATRFQGEDALTTAAQHIEHLAGKHPPRSAVAGSRLG